MKIRKEFRVESAHIVRNCTSERCSHSIHGHSAVIEIIFEGSKPDNAGMLMDFGLMKTAIKSFIDSMDHCYLLWNRDDSDFRKMIKKNSDRWIEFPFNPTAENLAVWIHLTVKDIIENTKFNNGENPQMRVVAVRYHETTTGYAESSIADLYTWLTCEQNAEGEFSDGVVKDFCEELRDYFDGGKIVNPTVKLQC